MQHDKQFAAICIWLKATSREMHVDRFGSFYLCRRLRKPPRKWSPPLWPAQPAKDGGGD